MQKKNIDENDVQREIGEWAKGEFRNISPNSYANFDNLIEEND